MGARDVLNSTILREYDIRGIVGETLFPDDAYNIARAFGSILVEDGGRSVAVGYDGRLSSPELEVATVEGLVSCGLKVFRIGLGPTPMLYFSVHHLNTDAGMMITGSHNPPKYNGIKMVMFGKAFFGSDIQSLGKRCATKKYVLGKGEVVKQFVFKEYVARLVSDFRGERVLRVAWDPGNGASGEVLIKVIEGLPGKHFVINEKIDGKFPAHHPDPTVEENLTQLKKHVVDNKCEVGIAFDGDGDRIGVVDAYGRTIWGDQLLVILAREVLLDQPGSTIISDVKASQIFLDEIERLGGKAVLWKSGHSHIKTKMVELSSPLAGEMSAHIFFKHRFYGFDDGIYAAIRLLSILASGSQKLSEIYDELPQMYNTPEIRIDCSEEKKFSVIDKMREILKTKKGLHINDIDGVRVTSNDGWWLLRASNTQPVLVVRCESRTEEGLLRLKEQLVGLLRKVGVNLNTL